MHEQYMDAVERLRELRGTLSLFDPDREILQNNLYGVDVNAEAIEIARLSVWIKTAQRGKLLADLDHAIRVGNSVVGDPGVDARALDWQTAFPEVFEQGGFDVVLGNPPYVRGELLGSIKTHLQESYASYRGDADLYVYFFELGLRLLRPGGRLSYIVTNKWMKAGYAAPLRRLFADEAWVESVVDLGHARQVFPDADVFPSIVLLARPTDALPPESTRVCVMPREQVRLDMLQQQVEEMSHDILRTSLTERPWKLDPPGLADLDAKLRRLGTPLGDYLGSRPLRGLMTGYNAAFVLTTAERDALIAKDPACSEHILRCYRGQDIKRWSPAWAELWMIVMRSSGDHDWPWRGMEEAQAEATFASTFPSLHAHFKQHEEALRTRRDQGQCWWELRSCDHYDAFTHPKLLYTDITWRPEIAYSSEPVVFVNTVYMWPTDDLFLLGVMNSPLMWSYFWRHAQHGKDEALRLFTEFLVNVPVPDADVRTRHRVEVRVEEMTHIAAERARRVNELLAWLALELDVAKPGKKLAEPFLLTRDEFVSEVRTRVPKKQLHPSAVTRLREAYADLVQPLIAAETRMRALETEVADLVHEAFDLTAEEVGLLWRTAPPRMPIERPQPVRPLAVLA